jgi:hypothetical protein
MIYCKVCGIEVSGKTYCCKPVASRCVPVHIPIDGYITFKQLSELSDIVSPQPFITPPQEEALTRPKIDIFTLSMGLVKWLGVIVICLTIVIFTIVVLKAFA